MIPRLGRLTTRLHTLLSVLPTYLQKQTTTHLDLHLVDGLQDPGLGRQLAGVQAPPGRGDDLSAATMDGVGVERHVVDVKADGAHVLLTQDTLKRSQHLYLSSS